MVLYFTGTGNSRYVAEALGEGLEDKVVSLNEVMKQGLEPRFESDKPFIVVAPIYAWRYPDKVERLLKEAKFFGSRAIYFVATMVSQTGKTEQYCKKIASMQRMDFKGFTGINMPNNYVIAGKMPTKDEIQSILTKAAPVIEQTVTHIREGQVLHKTDTTPMAGLLSGLINLGFSKFMVSSKKFVISDACISCKKCDAVCTQNNVTFVDGKPVFGSNCINCYACIHHCPTQAINIKGKTENNGRYLCPEWKG